MASTKLKLAPFYTKDLTQFLKNIISGKDTLDNKEKQFKTTVNVNSIECNLIIDVPKYNPDNQNDTQFTLLNHPIVQIYTADYDCYVSVNSNESKVLLRDTKTDIIIHTYDFNELDAIVTKDDLHDNNSKPFVQQVLTAFQVLKLIPVQTNNPRNQTQVLSNLITKLQSKIDHFENREQPQPTVQDMNDITSVLSFINTLDAPDSVLQGEATLQLQSTVQGTTIITSIGRKVEVTIIDPKDANKQYNINYDARESTVVYVTNKNNNEVLYQIPTFIFNSTDTDNEEEMKALRSTYNLYDGICTGFKVLHYFQHKGTFACTEHADAIKQAYYRALL